MKNKSRDGGGYLKSSISNHYEDNYEKESVGSYRHHDSTGRHQWLPKERISILRTGGLDGQHRCLSGRGALAVAHQLGQLPGVHVPEVLDLQMLGGGLAVSSGRILTDNIMNRHTRESFVFATSLHRKSVI